jgi:hypothetical protein
MRAVLCASPFLGPGSLDTGESEMLCRLWKATCDCMRPGSERAPLGADAGLGSHRCSFTA